MWNKIYLILLTLAIVVSGVLTYFSYSWLQSVTNPKDVFASYEKYASYNSAFLWISALVLFVTAIIVLWKSIKSWALWTTFLYFAFFTFLQTFWLEQMFFQFKKENNFSDAIVSFSPVLGITLIVLMAIFIFFTQFLIKRLHNKMYLQEQPVAAFPEETPFDENKI